MVMLKKKNVICHWYLYLSPKVQISTYCMICSEIFWSVSKLLETVWDCSELCETVWTVPSVSGRTVWTVWTVQKMDLNAEIKKKGKPPKESDGLCVYREEKWDFGTDFQKTKNFWNKPKFSFETGTVMNTAKTLLYFLNFGNTLYPPQFFWKFHGEHPDFPDLELGNSKRALWAGFA